MIDILTAEGIGYFENDLKDKGGFVFENSNGFIYAIHSNMTWPQTVDKIIDYLSCRWHIFGNPELLKTTKMKNGKTNYVFQFWLN